jgi:hypothetical protein
MWIFDKEMTCGSLTDTYRNIFVLREKTIEEPCDGAQCEEEGEEERHELDTSRAYHEPLHDKKTVNICFSLHKPFQLTFA